ncbi:hypothetical protein [Micromonospora rifamycinica]|uniref:hypothetical protein n=1 Tax=Micromonospora rifamycinica TaxID=291594 RepID=UPI0012FC841A|nr:hypothetical protein [Micromonospora rifamycinica]
MRPGDPFDLFILVLSMAFSWSAASIVHAATADEPDEDHERRRRLLAECVRGDLPEPGAHGLTPAAERPGGGTRSADRHACRPTG